VDEQHQTSSSRNHKERKRMSVRVENQSNLGFNRHLRFRFVVQKNAEKMSLKGLSTWLLRGF
jgi:hypothetical protein